MTEVLINKKYNKPYENILYMQLVSGLVVIELLPNIAPKTVKFIRYLANTGFYDGLSFYRAFENSIVEGGCPYFNGVGEVDQINGDLVWQSIEPLYYSYTHGHYTFMPHKRGMVGMVREIFEPGQNSRFYICKDDVPVMNGMYTIFGRVISGMEHIDNIKNGKIDDNGKVIGKQDNITFMRVQIPPKPETKTTKQKTTSNNPSNSVSTKDIKKLNEIPIKIKI